MKHPEKYEKELGVILKSDGLVKPSEAYSNNLKDMIVARYAKKEREVLLTNPWIARAIVGMAVIWCLLFLYFFRPFTVQPVFCVSILSFTIGVWGLIVLMRKHQISSMI